MMGERELRGQVEECIDAGMEFCRADTCNSVSFRLMLSSCSSTCIFDWSIWMRSFARFWDCIGGSVGLAKNYYLAVIFYKVEAYHSMYSGMQNTLVPTPSEFRLWRRQQQASRTTITIS